MCAVVHQSKLIVILALIIILACAGPPTYDVVILNGTVIDGSGQPGYRADVGIKEDQVSHIGALKESDGRQVIDATGLVVCPGFIDMMGQSEYRLLLDGRAQSKVHQGITTEVTGEGSSIAPLEGPALQSFQDQARTDSLEVDWTTLDGYFERLRRQGISINLATFVGAEQVRVAVIGFEDRPPTSA